MASSGKRSHLDLTQNYDHDRSSDGNQQSCGEDGNSRTNNNLTSSSRKQLERNSPSYSNESVPNTPIQVHISSVASSPEIRDPVPSGSPHGSPKPQPKLRDKLQSSPGSTSSFSRDPSVEKSLDAEAASSHGYEDTVSRSSESIRSVDLQRSPDTGSIRDLNKDKKNSDKKKKSSSWYNVLNPTYKSRSDDFKRLFKDLPEHERLIVDYSCALQKDILVQGRLYISQNYICFYANIFRWETLLMIRCKDVTAMTKEKTARVIPNAIQICTEAEKHFFTSFGARDKTYLMLFRVWQNALLEQPMSIQELWQWVHYSYGDELGLTSDDDDYVAPCAIEEDGKNNGILLLPDGKEAKLPKTPSDHMDLSSKTSSFKESPTGSTENQVLLNGSTRDISDIPDTPLEAKPLPREKILKLPEIALTDAHIPTDLSDTTESDNEVACGEIHCLCEDHVGKEILNTVFPMSVDQLYSLLFCGSKFFSQFLHSRKTTDVVQSGWQDHIDTGNKLRQVTYTLHFNLSMGPKTAQTTETQTMMNVSKAGSLYVIEVDAVNTGIPYSDTFYTSHRYCLTQVSGNKCRIRVHSQIKYRKSAWGLVKTFIEKNAMQGVEEYFKDLETAVHRECTLTNQLLKPKKARRRRRLLKSCLSEDAVVDGGGKSTLGHSAAKRLGPSAMAMDMSRIGNPECLVKVIFLVLVALLFLNALLYYKLWSLESQTTKMTLPPNLLDLEILRSSPRSSEEWAQLVQQQEALHQVELQKWTEILQSAVHLLQQTEDSLNALQKSIRPYQMQRILQFIVDPAEAPKDTITVQEES